jgi:hypothetical protein
MKESKIKVKWMIGYICPKCKELFKEGEDIVDEDGYVIHWKCKKKKVKKDEKSR